MQKRSVILIFFIVVVLILILTIYKKNVATEQITWKNWSSINSEEKCKSYGGNWTTWSIWQGDKKQCDMPYPDSGKVCTDGSECESKLCLYNLQNPIVNSSANGTCATGISISCVNHFYFVVNGKIVSGACVE